MALLFTSPCPCFHVPIPIPRINQSYRQVEAVETGCRGCSSGKAGYANIFGNKYGQYLATVQYMREVQAGLIDAPETRTEQKKKAKKKSKKRKVRVSV